MLDLKVKDILKKKILVILNHANSRITDKKNYKDILSKTWTGKALNTLINERNELIRMAQMTEQIMQAHMKRLEELGVKVQTGKPAGK